MAAHATHRRIINAYYRVSNRTDTSDETMANDSWFHHQCGRWWKLRSTKPATVRVGSDVTYWITLNLRDCEEDRGMLIHKKCGLLFVIYLSFHFFHGPFIFHFFPGFYLFLVTLWSTTACVCPPTMPIGNKRDICSLINRRRCTPTFSFLFLPNRTRQE